jgi:hypothetical protein
MSNKRSIIDYVIDQIELDIQNGDVTALEELLKHIPVEYLQGYLPLISDYVVLSYCKLITVSNNAVNTTEVSCHDKYITVTKDDLLMKVLFKLLKTCAWTHFDQHTKT